MELLSIRELFVIFLAVLLVVPGIRLGRSCRGLYRLRRFFE